MSHQETNDNSVHSAFLSRRGVFELAGLTGLASVLAACSGSEQQASGPTTSVASANPTHEAATYDPSVDSPSPSSSPSVASSLRLPKSVGPFNFTKHPDGPVDAKLWTPNLDPAVPGYNEEAETYTKSLTNVRMQGGHLILEAVKTEDGYTSGRIETDRKFYMKYGEISVVAKLPEGIGTWPAVWLLPDETQTDDVLKKYGITDPDDGLKYVWGGEIDFLEAIGGQNQNEVTAHTHNTRKKGSADGYTHDESISDISSAYHAYGLHKKPGLLQFTLDGRVIHEQRKRKGDGLEDWPFDDFRYFLIANLAMGGQWTRDVYPGQFLPLGIDDSKGPSWKFDIAQINYTPYSV